MSQPEILVAVPLLLMLAVTTIIDWRKHKIPNAWTFGGAGFALITHATIGGFSGFAFAAAGWIVCLACFMPFYLRRGMSAGDVKLIAAVGAFLGPGPGLFASLCALIAGGALATASLAYRLRADSIEAVSAGAADTARGWNAVRAALQIRIPYAGAIACGTAFVVLVPSAIPPVLAQLGGWS